MLWEYFDKLVIPKKVHHILLFPFVDNDSHCGLLESPSLKNGFVIVSWPIHIRDFTRQHMSYISLFLVWDLLANVMLSEGFYLSDFLTIKVWHQSWVQLGKLYIAFQEMLLISVHSWFKKGRTLPFKRWSV